MVKIVATLLVVGLLILVVILTTKFGEYQHEVIPVLSFETQLEAFDAGNADAVSLHSKAYLLKAEGRSMKHGEVGEGPFYYLIFPTPYSDLQVGQAVVYSTPEGQVGHRIISGSPATGFRTKGDANKLVDPWVLNEDNYIGHLKAVYRWQ